ncbi:hypothetical protein [Kibdelosporangium aridum]|uniref:hypothetical protein n=1 Tax=Kibdelosporangium aridum TaxID=2030 RepID=UPI000A03CF20|nr:hypothetical protein [Kibdelosporangium aridum]
MMDRADNLRTAAVHDMYTLSRKQRYLGVRVVASAADDATDCLQLLAALGLDPADGRSPSEEGLAGSSPASGVPDVRGARGLVRRRFGRGRV